MKFGIYYYGWYKGFVWKNHKRKHTPLIGLYDSSSLTAVQWQFKIIVSMGIDFVIFEMVSPSDINFSTITKNLEIAIKECKKVGLSYSFLIDCGGFIENRNEVLDKFDSTLRWLDYSLYLCNDNFLKEDGTRILYTYSALPFNVSRSITLNYNYRFKLLHITWMPVWRQPLTSASIFCNQRVCDLYERWTPGLQHNHTPVLDILGKEGFSPFWQETKDIISTNDHVAIIPGYDDRLLRRDPQLAPIVMRNQGNTLVEQFYRGVKTGAEFILIYGWNEYFEATNIEPTIEYGDFYVELTRRLILQAKQGVEINFPEDLDKPYPAKPIYLNFALEQAAQRHPDKVPRWDQDYYLAEIRTPSSIETNDSFIVFRNVTVINIGLKSWKIAKGPDPIRLGTKLYNSRGNILQEARAELSTNDLETGNQVTVDLQIDITNLAPGQYSATIDVVWENKFWFGSTGSKIIELAIKQDELYQKG